MVNARFGHAVLSRDEPTEIDRVLDDNYPEALDSVTSQMVIREAYEISFSIFDHENNSQHPWDLVLSRDKENYTDYDKLSTTIERFHDLSIHEHFGISLVELFKMPRVYVDRIFKIADRGINKENRQLKETIKQMSGQSVKRGK